MLLSSLKRALITAAKSEPCMDCKCQFEPYQKHFDHREPSRKLFNLASAPAHTLAEILRELHKCDVVCANCHAERTRQLMVGGFMKRGKRNVGRPSKGQATVPQVVDLHTRGMSLRAIAKTLGVAKSTIERRLVEAAYATRQ